MKRIQYLAVACLLAATAVVYGQGSAAPKAGAAGNAKKGKDVFDQQCGLCHDALTTDKKMGPGLKGLFKMQKLSTNKKPVNDANVMERVNQGGNGMPPYEEMISAADKADLLAYLKTI